MILLLGGTSEAGTIAAALAEAGVGVLVSTATAITSSVQASDRIAVRSGPLDEAGLHDLIHTVRARIVVDATHPYASAVTENARQAAARAGVPYLRYRRPPAAAAQSGLRFVRDHEEAARWACRSGDPVLLTIGTRHLAPYLREARRTAAPVVARILPWPESLRTCESAGLPRERIVIGQAPFSVEATAAVIRCHSIRVLVTKDGGAAGGVPEKLEAARREGCEVVVVARPEEAVVADCTFFSVKDLVAVCVDR